MILDTIPDDSGVTRDMARSRLSLTTAPVAAAPATTGYETWEAPLADTDRSPVAAGDVPLPIGFERCGRRGRAGRRTCARILDRSEVADDDRFTARVVPSPATLRNVVASWRP